MEGVHSARLVGREAELAALRDAVSAALRGDGLLALVVGEAGIGKSHIARAVAELAAERGAVVAWGRSPEGEGAPSYWPFIQALEACAADGEQRALLARLRAGEASDPTDPVLERARFALCDSVATSLTATARARPLVLLLDDLHWADEGSLVLLEFLARQLAGVPLLVLATVRDDSLGGGAPRARALARLTRLARTVSLRGLTRSAVADLLAAELGEEADDAVLERVVELTDGNPFFVLEVARVLAGGAERQVPHGVRELFLRRLEPLAPGSRRALDAAAVFGREFELGPVAHALGESVESLLEALAAPSAQGLVRPVPGALRRFAFVHALLRETVYAELPVGARAALHGALSLALEADGAATDERLPLLAHHAFEAAQAGNPARAVAHGCAAGERALRLLAFEEAARHFDRVLGALALAPDEAVRLRVLRGLAESLHAAGDRPRADEAFRAAVTAARAHSPATFCETILRFSGVRAELGTLDVELNELLEEAVAAVPAGAVSLRARLLARLAVGLRLATGSGPRCKQLLDEAVALARAAGDPGTLSWVLARRLVVLLGPDHLAERLAATDEILRSPTRSRRAELDALMVRITDLVELGDRAGLDQALEVFAQKARASGEPFFAWMEVSFRAAMAVLEGRFADGESLAAQALALGRHVQAQTPLLRYAQLVFMLRGWQGRLAEVSPIIERSAATAAVVPSWRAALANLYSILGREAEARRELDSLAADDFAALHRDATWLPAVELLAATAVRLDDRRRAAVLYELLLPHAGRIATSSPLVVVTGPTDRVLGMLASVLGRHDEAERLLADSLALSERMRALPWQADTRFQWAEMLRRRGALSDRARAERLLDEAEAIARSVGMELLLDWIEKARKAEWFAADSLPAPAAERRGAFRREGDVWTLSFESRTTRVRDMVGLAHLARLLASPGREIHVGELVSDAYAARRDSPGERTPASDSGALLDPRARAEYAARLREAREELEDARRANDLGRAERLAEEVEALGAELTRGFGLGGRERRAGSAHERARVSVTRAIKYAVDKVAEHDAALAEHLRLAVRTGTFCVYAPGSRDQVSWSL